MKFEADEPVPVDEIPDTDDRGVAKFTDDELDKVLAQVTNEDSDQSLFEREVQVDASDAEEEADVEEVSETEEPTEEAETEEVEAEEELDDAAKRLAAIEKKLEASEVLRERQELKAEKYRLQADTQAGRLGSLMEKMEKQRVPQETHVETAEESEAVSELRSEIQRERQERRQEGLQLAIEREAKDFYEKEALGFLQKVQESAGDEAVKKVGEFIRTRVDKGFAELGEDLTNATPKTGSKWARLVYKDALLDAKEQIQSEIAEMGKAKKVKSDKVMKGMKRATQTVKRKGTRVVAANPGNKRVQDMSDKELDAVIRQGFA